MDAFFSPGSVAIAGASKSLMKLGNVPIDNLLRFGYQGRIIPVNPDGGEIMGLRAYPSLEDVEGSVDLAVAVIPRENICSFLDSCGRAGVRNAIITAAGVRRRRRGGGEPAARCGSGREAQLRAHHGT